MESTHRPCPADNKLPCGLATSLSHSYLNLVHISPPWSLSLFLSLHKQKRLWSESTWTQACSAWWSILSSLSHIYGSWGECCLVGDLTPRIHAWWWMVSDQASFPPTQYSTVLPPSIRIHRRQRRRRSPQGWFNSLQQNPWSNSPGINCTNTVPPKFLLGIRWHLLDPVINYLVLHWSN